MNGGSIRRLIRAGVMGVFHGMRADLLALRTLRRMTVRRRIPVVRVVNLHATRRPSYAQLREQLEWVLRHFVPLDLEGFSRLWDLADWTPTDGGRPYVLFTFDDGLENNYTVAAPVLEGFGVRGVFFVVPQFAELQGEDSRRFYYSRICGYERVPMARTEEEAWKPMSPDQIADLATRGHAIGNHTWSHAPLIRAPTLDLEREIVESRRRLESWTGKEVAAFAWPFWWNTISSEAWKLACRSHRFCFTPCPGLVRVRRDSPGLLWRTNVEVFYRPMEYRLVYAGLGDAYWFLRRRRLRRTLRGDVLAAY